MSAWCPRSGLVVAIGRPRGHLTNHTHFHSKSWFMSHDMTSSIQVATIASSLIVLCTLGSIQLRARERTIHSDYQLHRWRYFMTAIGKQKPNPAPHIYLCYVYICLNSYAIQTQNDGKPLQPGTILLRQHRQNTPQRDIQEKTATAFGYNVDDLASLPEKTNLGVSCGNPWHMQIWRKYIKRARRHYTPRYGVQLMVVYYTGRDCCWSR